MDNFIKNGSSKAKFAGMILLFAATLFSSLECAGAIGRSFMSVFGGLILFFFNLAVIGIIPLLIVLKKDSSVKYALIPVFSYWLISNVYNYFGNGTIISKNTSALSTALYVFEFLVGCALLCGIVFAVLYFFRKKRAYLQIGFCTVACSLLFFFIAWVLYIARAAKNEDGWINYIYAFYNFLFLPAGLVCVIWNCLAGNSTVIAKTERAEEKLADRKEEDVSSNYSSYDENDTAENDYSDAKQEEEESYYNFHADESDDTDYTPIEIREEDGYRFHAEDSDLPEE